MVGGGKLGRNSSQINEKISGVRAGASVDGDSAWTIFCI